MNVASDYKFGPFLIPQKFILGTTAHLFYLLVPNPIVKGRK